MTEKLYYDDAYIKEFTAEVKDLARDSESYIAVLDRTAFFPEEGGQSADTGFIGDAAVKDVRERNGVIYHYLDRPLSIGQSYACRIDFADRFEKMQCHTAEHIISGAINKLYGLDNVGFHLGKTDVTMDINGVLSKDQLDEIEAIANRAVFENVPIRTYFPSADELANLTYRSKLDLTDNVRIVEIEGYDMCACCAPHVSYTGEIGLIKILDFEKHRGGLRINIAAGYRALYDYREKYRNVQRISALFSEPQATVADAAEGFVKAYEEQKGRVKAARLEISSLRAELLPKHRGSVAIYYPNMSIDEMRELANCAKSKVGGIIAVLTGEDHDVKYVMTSATVDLAGIYKSINSALLGRGGGRDNMIQGSFGASIEEIKSYFDNLEN